MADPKDATGLDALHHLVTADALAVRAVLLDDQSPRAIAVPEGWSVEQLDPARWDHLRDAPRRLVAGVRFEDPAAFARYVTAHHGAGTTAWIHPAFPYRAEDQRSSRWGLGVVCTAVLDDHHTSGRPGWRRHVARLVLQPTADWQRLQALEAAGLVRQADMADRLEAVAHVFDGDWSGAKLLTLLDSLEGTSSYSVKAVDPLGSSTRVTIDAGQKVVGAGGLEIPRTLELVVAPFKHLLAGVEGDAATVFAARMRARLVARIANGDGLSLQFSLRQPEALLEAAERALVEFLAAAMPVEVWHGDPGPLDVGA